MAQQQKQPQPAQVREIGREYGLHENITVEPDPNADVGESDENEGAEQDSEESEGQDADASQDTEAGQALEDLKADKGDEGEEGPSEEQAEKDAKKDKKFTTIAAAKRDLDKAQKQLEDKEEQIRKLQSRADRAETALQTQMTQFWNELNRLKSGEQRISTEGDLPEIDDEAVIDGKTFKGFIKGAQSKRKAEEDANATYQQKLAWVSSQPDIADVRKMVTDEKWNLDPEVQNTPTDMVGLYFRGKSILLQRKLDSLDKQHKQEIERAKAEERKKFANRKPIPPVGGNGDLGRGNSGPSLEPQSEVEKRFLGFVRKVDPNAKILRHGR